MSQPTTLRQASCADDYDPNSMPVVKARELIRNFLKPVAAVERVHIRNALGRVLATDIVSPFAVPGHDNSAMDGYAVRFADLRADGETTLRRVGESFAGKPWTSAIGAGECVRIFTGGVMPPGADSVVVQERTTEASGQVTIARGALTKAGQHRRFAGEDLKAGQVVFRAGQRVNPAEIGMMASLGIGEVGVYRKLRVAFFSTGDELKAIGTPLAAGEIYDSNRYTLYGMLTRLGCEVVDMGVVRRRAGATRARLRRGGAKRGRRDHVRRRIRGRSRLRQANTRQARRGAVLEDRHEAGSTASVWQARRGPFLRAPGQSRGRDGDVLPVRTRRAADPAGQREVAPLPMFKVPLSAPIRKLPGRTEFQRGILTPDGTGGFTVRTTGDQGSGILSSMSQANCFIVLDTATGDVAAGTPVDVQLLEGLI